MKKIRLTKKAIRGRYTFTVSAKNSVPITIESLQKIYTTARVIPYKFTPTNEIVYLTAEERDLIEKAKEIVASEAVTSK